MSSDATVPSVRYLDPVYDQLAQLRAENEALRTELDAVEQQRDNWHITARDERDRADERNRAYETAEVQRNDERVRAARAERALERAEERVDQLTDERDQWKEAAGTLHDEAEETRQELARTRDALDRRTATQNATGEANDALVRRAIAAERTIEDSSALLALLVERGDASLGTSGRWIIRHGVQP
jgi:chromosome segregation ATPase